MDELSSIIAEIQQAKTGSEIRNPLVNAFKWVFEHGRNVQYLNTHDSDYYAKQSDMAKLLPFDNWARRPSSDSQKLVTGATIYATLGDLHELPTIVEEIIDHG